MPRMGKYTNAIPHDVGRLECMLEDAKRYITWLESQLGKTHDELESEYELHLVDTSFAAMRKAFEHTTYCSHPHPHIL